MGWFIQQCLSWILLYYAVAVSCQELTSTLGDGNHTCPGEVVTFTCAISGSSGLALAWSSNEYIGQGNLLQFTAESMPGTNRTSIINGNVTAMRTSNTTINGVPVLESKLRIVAVQASTVMCITTGSTVSKEFFVAEIPGVPQNVRAAEISELTGSSCIILVTWNPPVNTDQSDINEYRVYVPSQGIMITESSAISVLHMLECGDDLRIQVTAVNLFGCMGPNFEVQPRLPDIISAAPTENGTVATSNTHNTPIQDESTSASSQLGAGALIGITLGTAIVILSVSIVVAIVILLYFRRKGKALGKKITDNQQLYQEKIKEDRREGDLKGYLFDLYSTLRSQSGKEIAPKPFRERLKKEPLHVIKEALKNSLEVLNLEERDDMRRALDKLMKIMPEMPYIDVLKNTTEELSKAVSPPEDENAGLDDLIKKVEEAPLDEIKQILLELCEKLIELTKLQEEIVRKFEISQETLREVERLLMVEFEEGLKREGEDIKVKMLITHVYSMPDRMVEGEFLVLDLGGNNFRVLYIKSHEGKTRQDSETTFLDAKTKALSQEALFDFIADSVTKFIEEKKIKTNLPIGFIFSFPVDQKSLDSGRVIRWTKGFTTKAVSMDVVQMLKDALKKRGDVESNVVALVNNATALQLAMGIKVPGCSIALTLGDGTNACYMECLNAVPKFKGDHKHHSQVIINTEWGAFGDDGKLENWRTDYDSQLDEHSSNPGQQIFEKMISSKYLGEIVRLALKDLIKQGALFGGKSSTLFDKVEAFGSKHLSNIERGNISDCQKIFKSRFHIEASDQDCVVVQRVCAAVSTRAARLAAAGVVALARKINKINGCSVAVDSPLYRRHFMFPERMRAAMMELEPENNIEMKLAKDGPGRGAAIAAAMANNPNVAELHECSVISETGEHKDGNFQDHGHNQPLIGDFNAVPERKSKKGSKEGPSEMELCGMCSVPDKSNKQMPTYANLDVPAESQQTAVL